jgi:cytochrome c oxidase subunit IV
MAQMHTHGETSDPDVQTHEHPGPRKYVMIGIVLSILTAAEVAAYYIDALSPVLVPILLVLSAAKFILVVQFYMHLKFDSKIFTSVFVGPMALAALVIISLIILSTCCRISSFWASTPGVRVRRPVSGWRAPGWKVMQHSMILAVLHPVADFSWTRFTTHPSILIGCLLFAGLYLYAVGPLRARYGWAESIETPPGRLVHARRRRHVPGAERADPRPGRQLSVQRAHDPAPADHAGHAAAAAGWARRPGCIGRCCGTARCGTPRAC